MAMKRVKTISLMLVLFWLWTTSAFAAMSTSEVRENARFMTDRMAYELGLSSMQRNDVYEINYDFFESVRFVMDDLATGYSYAIDRYYESLDLRNDDLSYVLTRGQFERFMSGTISIVRSMWTIACVASAFIRCTPILLSIIMPLRSIF